MSAFCKERNIIGNSRGFLKRVLTADSVVTPEKCQKYFISCQRCKNFQTLVLVVKPTILFQVHASIQGGCDRDECAAEDKGNQEVSQSPFASWAAAKGSLQQEPWAKGGTIPVRERKKGRRGSKGREVAWGGEWNHLWPGWICSTNESVAHYLQRWYSLGVGWYWKGYEEQGEDGDSQNGLYCRTAFLWVVCWGPKVGGGWDQGSEGVIWVWLVWRCGSSFFWKCASWTIWEGWLGWGVWCKRWTCCK